MKNKKSLVEQYTSAGVDQDLAQCIPHLLAPSAQMSPQQDVLSALGGFYGAHALPSLPDGGALVACTDGVGTKVLLAAQLGRFEHLGQDCVAMCVNDILTTQATPLFFMDYVGACSLDASTLEIIVRGIAQACASQGCALLGGESAQMPGVYTPQGWDVVGFCVGLRAPGALTLEAVRPGDALIGLASSGFHANGFSLLRTWIQDHSMELEAPIKASHDLCLADALLAPTTLYGQAMDAARRAAPIASAAHITGGGITGNLPRALPHGCGAALTLGSWETPAVIHHFMSACDFDVEQGADVFNMGLGMVLICPESDARACLEAVNTSTNTRAWRVGHVTDSPGVRFVKS